MGSKLNIDKPNIHHQPGSDHIIRGSEMGGEDLIWDDVSGEYLPFIEEEAHNTDTNHHCRKVEAESKWQAKRIFMYRI
jgi:hypothetical protein